MKTLSLLFLSLSLAACARDPSAASTPDEAGAKTSTSLLRETSVKTFVVTRGLVEIRGSLTPCDDRDADVEIVLDVRSVSRDAEVQYRYRLRVPLASREALELCVRDRHMYAVVPRGGATWSSLFTSSMDLADTLEVIRLDGAGEES